MVPLYFSKKATMKPRRIIYLLFLFLLHSTAHPQYEEIYRLKRPFEGMVQKKPVAFRPFPVFKDSTAFRVYLFVEIQYDYLLFRTQGEKYVADAEIEVVFKENDDAHGYTRLWQTTVQTATFDSTNLKHLFHFTMDTLTVPPAKYSVYFRYTDLNGALQFRIKRKMDLTFDRQPFISGPLLIYPDTAPPEAFPQFPGRPSAFGQHWDFNRDVTVLFHYRTPKEDFLRTFRIGIYSDETGRTALQTDTSWTAPPRVTFLAVPMAAHLLPEGKYEIRTEWGFSSQAIKRTSPFKVIWFDKPLSLWNLRQAIKPLRYLMEEDDYLRFRDAPLPLLKRRFREFWRERDPTPGTPFNEAMAEFYRRVDIANRRWSDKGEKGWETDIGKIFILYGEPDFVEDHSLDPERKPYLKWVYYLEDRKVEVIFISIEGRKAYRLEELKEIPYEKG